MFEFKTAIIGPTEEIKEIEGEICMEDDETAESVIAQILRTAMNYDDCPLPVSEYEVVNEFEIEVSPLEEYLPSGFTQAYAAIGLYGPDNDGSADADAIWFIAINE
uniref:RpoC_6 protein n=1 Tax=Fopius arisanus TaxID=64838 RepID=A0A0C9Q5X1_9HYME